MTPRPLAALLLLAAATALPIEAQRRDDRPNVVVIIMDDLGYGDIGSYGAPDARTPNLDRLAREGVRFTDAYANGSNCSPTRAGFISGQYQQRWGIEWPLGSVATDTGLYLPPTGRTLPALLKRNGYATGLIGKWHLGFKPEMGPNAHGFDEFFGFLGGALDYYAHIRGDGTPDLYENTTPVEVKGYLTDTITGRAVRFVDAHASSPFFLEVAYNAVHWPFQVPGMPDDTRHRAAPGRAGDQSLYDGAADSAAVTRADYVRMLERADRGVGEILAALARHGLTRNTLVIFTSDNGGEWLSRNAPLAQRKSSLWEGGIRVPLLMRWPARIAGGRTTRQVAITMDLTATVLAATGSPVPAELKVDGMDLMPVLRGAPTVERQLFWRRLRPTEQRAVRSGRWKLFREGPNFYLFDVVADPGERNDLTAKYPQTVAKLAASIAAWERDVGAPRPAPVVTTVARPSP
ncbi:MAG TPA: sulfatase-like hydrolase/transferase [Gemmatimonadaceae bacterium]|nr:sulfatase-like hydrolase/transferase [Gemmatimonadaceae bacterium]